MTSLRENSIIYGLTINKYNIMTVTEQECIILRGKYLYKFLRKRMLFDKYLKACKDYRRLEYDTAMDKAKRKNNIMLFFCTYPYYSISNAFIWASTDEGDLFWRMLSEEFEREIQPIIMWVLDVWKDKKSKKS